MVSLPICLQNCKLYERKTRLVDDIYRTTTSLCRSQAASTKKSPAKQQTAPTHKKQAHRNGESANSSDYELYDCMLQRVKMASIVHLSLYLFRKALQQ